ncbi:MAG: hypothetical protein K2X77_09300 [Candidatus Obscuribacterales bacterium]|jgi:hypothetical protein|nr:hypothetical protein [Candidatus Obscuribacterales bacterium]
MMDDGEQSGEESAEVQSSEYSEQRQLKSRSEAGDELQSGSLNETKKSVQKKQFSSGNSGVSGLFESNGDGGLPKAKDLFGEFAHAPLTKEQEKTFLSMKESAEKGELIGDGGKFIAQVPSTTSPESLREQALDVHAEKIRQSTSSDGKWHFQKNPSDVAGKSKEDLWNKFHSTPQESLNEIAAEKEHKLLPKDGQSISVKQLLTDYKTPFMDAYEHSRRLKDGDPGKSKTLESVVDRIKDCPWVDRIRIKFDSTAKNPDYNPVESTITIRPQDPPAAQIEKFVHEGTHATHQELQKLYMGDEPLSKVQYADTLAEIEALTFKNEISVHNELTAGMGAEPVTYKWRDGNDRAQPDMNLGKLYAEHGFEGLKRFILDDAFTDMQDLTQQWHSWNYRTYYQETHSVYQANWQNARNQLQERFKEDPLLKAKILKGGY